MSRPGLGICLLVALSVTCTQAVLADDWPRFRGPDQTGVAAAGSAADWPPNPSLEVVWRADLGSGYSGLAITGGSVFTGWAEGESDWLGAFDAATGERRWQLSLGPLYSGHDGSHNGPIATPVVAEVGGRSLVFGVGGHGRLLAATTKGDQVWTRELSELGNAPFYGFSASPLVVDGATGPVLVMEVASGEGPTVVGFDALTGEVRWQQGDDVVHYQSPVAVTLGDREQVVASGEKTLFGLEPRTGEVLWSHDYGGEVRAMGSASNVPVHLGGNLLLVKPDSHSTVAMAIASGDDGWQVENRWTNSDLARSYAPALHSGGLVFGYKGAFLVAVDAHTGDTVWRSRPPGDGFLASADGHLVVVTKKGSLHLARADAAGWSELASLDVFDFPDRDNTVWSEPAVAGGDIYVRSMSGLARLRVRSAVSAEAEVRTAEAAQGPELPAGAFAEFVAGLRQADDKKAAVEAFVASRSANGGFPIIEGEHAIFVFQTDETSVGIEGDMLGERTQGQMRHAAGTDLFYFASRLPTDTWVSYRFVPGLGEPVVDPLNTRRTQIMGFGGPEEFSFLTMPDWRLAEFMLGEPTTRGQLVHHDVALPSPESPAEDVEDAEPESEEPAGEDGKPAEPQITSRGIDVFLPDAFDAKSGEVYPVVFVIGSEMVRQPMELDRALSHYLGRSLPPAIVVLVGPHDPRPMADLFRGFEAAADSFFEQVVPFVREHYPVAAGAENQSYAGFTMSASLALGLGLDPRSRAGRLALVQPFFLDTERQAHVESAKTQTEHRPHLYLETSPLSLRGEEEGWNAAHQTETLATELEGLGYRVTRGSSNLPFVPEALQPRVGAALAFAVVGSTEFPLEE